MTRPQRDLLAHLAEVGTAQVHGNQLRVAFALARLGYVEVGVGGSGVAYMAPWWWEARITDNGRKAI